jgi:allantoate deiminase
MARLDALAAFTDQPGQPTRLYLTPAHKAAALQVRAWMREAGLEAEIDAVGNVVGRREGREPGLPAVILGSHIDTVRNAGRYDGNLGVVAAIAVAERLAAEGKDLPFAIEVVAFGDEEGVRFPVTLTGSRALAGTVNPAALRAVDAEGVSLAAALESFGGAPDRIAQLRRDPAAVHAYLELHIEQGPVLEDAGLPVGVVTAISGASRFVVTVEGKAGHAGTVPMALRRDAGAAAAAMLLSVEQTARETAALLATVGCLNLYPGAVNVIPATGRFTLDVRSGDDDVRRAGIARLEEAFAHIAAERGLSVTVERTYEQDAVPCAPWLVEQMAEAVARTGVRPLLLPSGAGHDGLALASLCPIGMLFVRCKGGISHDPAESIDGADAAQATEILFDILHNLKVPRTP